MVHTIRGKLLALAFAVTITVAGVVAGWWTALNGLKVNGPVYAQIVLVKDLVADILPPPEYILESYMLAAKALDAEESELRALRARIGQLKREYDERHAFWSGTTLEPKIAEGLLKASYLPAIEFYRLAEGAFFPALERADRDVARKTFRAMSAAYETHRAAIDEVVEEANRLGRQTETDAASSETLYKAVVLGVTVALTAMVLGIVAVVIRSIRRPVADMIVVMQRLADGDATVAVSGTGRRDEIGDIARTVEVFKTHVVENVRLAAAAKEAERQTVAERRRVLGQTAEDFERTMSAIMGNVGTEADHLEHSAQAMAAVADQVLAQASSVAAASNQAAVNVQTVAAATEQLSASVREIGRQVAESAAVSRAAVEEARQTDATVRSLSEAADRISEVVSLINDIAAQTNLLALNATIEAARAGEAGKGFAVVANEVKNLASQTARATDEIVQQIEAVQGETRRATDAIAHVGETIGRLNAIASAIAAAVEQQTAATGEIARNVEQAAKGTQGVSDNVGGVRQAAAEAGGAASEVLTAARRLNEGAVQLRRDVGVFLDQVRAG